MTSEALQAALAEHQRGNLTEARRRYQEILDTDPTVADAWHLLGLVALVEQDWNTAREKIERAIDLDETKANFHYHLGETYRCSGFPSAAESSCRRALLLEPNLAMAHNLLGLLQDGELRRPQAIASFREAIRCNPNLIQAHCNLGAALQAAGDHAAAEACRRQALALDNNFAPAWESLGNVLTEQGRSDEAIAAYREAIARDPNLIQAEVSLGLLLQVQGLLDEAIACYERVLLRSPDLAQVHCNLGSAHKDQLRFEPAVACYQRALAIDPRMAEAHFNLGVILQRGNELDAARVCYETAIACQPDYAHAYNNLGTIHKMEHRSQEAVACYQRALEVVPEFAEALNNLGNMYKLEARDAAALAYYERALASQPDYAQAHYNRALALLTLGDFETGWREYEWRLRCPDIPKSTRQGVTWEGEPLAGRRLLIQAEQGLGDTFQFARYVKLLDRGDESISFEVFPALVPLLKQSGFRNLIVPSDTSDDFDVRLPLMSLPHLMNTTLDHIPAEVPYLSADPRLVDAWRDRLQSLAGFKVGIAWQGSASFPSDYMRSIPLVCFEPLAADNVRLISLQKGHGSEQLAALGGRFAVHDLAEQLDVEHGPFMDTAAVMQSVDLVVTCDTAIAHLAGGLGVPTWLALPVASEWRWLRKRSDCPWYPTMRIFRQSKAGDWSTVFEPMAAELQRLAHGA